MNKLFSMVAGAALLALAGTAQAGNLQLSDRQMDGVTAGGAAVANGVSVTLGEVLSDTATQLSTNVSTASFPHIAIAEAASTGTAAGGFLFQAFSQSHVDTFATLP